MALFDLKNVGRSAARFDFAKLSNLNGHYMRQTDDKALLAALEEMLPHVESGKAFAEALSGGGRDRLLAMMPGLKERAKTLQELLDGARFLFATRPLKLDEKAAALLEGEGRKRLADVYAALEAAPAWDVATTEAGRPPAGGDIRRQARATRPAAARCADGPVDLSRHLRRARGARPRGEPWTPEGPALT